MQPLIKSNSQRVLIAILLFMALMLNLAGCGRSTCAKYQTCSICKSTRKIETKYRLRFIPDGQEEVIKFKSKNYDHGVHQWEDGISSAVIDPVPDGVLVLVRKETNYGAFILKDQDVDPEKTNYTWYYRTDGKGFFDKKLTNVITGSGNGKRIEFGPFNINWSGNTKGSGWLYYLRFDGSPRTSKDLYICVTGEKALAGIDAASSRWTYKSAPYDN